MDMSPQEQTTSKPFLTHREQEVLILASEGLTNKEIAARLWLSTDTVKSHLQALTAKLNTRGRTHSVATALRLGLIE